MPSQRPQYGGTVHLFIGTGHSPYKITSMPFTFGSNSIVIHQGLNDLFIFKSVSFSATTPKLSCSHLRRRINLRIIWASPTVISTRVQRYLFTHYTPETLLNLVFEDLRKLKAPNTPHIQLIQVFHLQHITRAIAFNSRHNQRDQILSQVQNHSKSNSD
jgi:hypothetical protein